MNTIKQQVSLAPSDIAEHKARLKAIADKVQQSEMAPWPEGHNLRRDEIKFLKALAVKTKAKPNQAEMPKYMVNRLSKALQYCAIQSLKNHPLVRSQAGGRYCVAVDTGLNSNDRRKQLKEQCHSVQSLFMSRVIWMFRRYEVDVRQLIRYVDIQFKGNNVSKELVRIEMCVTVSSKPYGI